MASASVAGRGAQSPGLVYMSPSPMGGTSSPRSSPSQPAASTPAIIRWAVASAPAARNSTRLPDEPASVMQRAITVRLSPPQCTWVGAKV